MVKSARTGRIVWAGMVGLSGTFLYLILSIFYNNLPLENGFVMRNGMLLGGDFITFYVAGKMYSTDPSQLYDLVRQKEVRTLMLGASSTALNGELPFVYPPLIAVLFSALANLSFSEAYIAWSVLALLVSFSSFFVVLCHLRRHQVLFLCAAFIVLAGYFPFSMNSILGGQLSWIGFSLICWVFFMFEWDKPFLAGLLMSLSYYKPPLFLLALIVFLFTQGRYFFWGFFSGATILVMLTIWAVGLPGLASYIGLVSRYTYGQKLFADVELPPGEGAGIFALITTLSPDMHITMVLFGAMFLVAALILICYSRVLSINSWYLWYATVWVASVGFSLQCIRYDLALIFLPMFLIFLVMEQLSFFSSLLIGIGFFGFYLEWLFRGKECMGVVLNLSSFLFVYLLVILLFLTIALSRKKLRC
jgi:hypothetical protein